MTALPHPAVNRIVLLARDIKISHTVFALPWAVLATFLAARGFPHPGQLLLILMCMVTARTVAMTANRLLDAQLDSLNPRTANRAIPAGALSRGFVFFILLVCAAAFVASTGGFWSVYGNRWPLIWSLPVLLFLSAYPLLKRFTQLCHYYLGAALALAPVCAWIAIRGNLSMTPLLMAGAVLTWTAGFDIIYACQDYEADLRHGVFSVPSIVGIARALWISRATHCFCVALLIATGWSATPWLGSFYFVGVAIAVGLLAVEHGLVSPTDLSKVGLAFFTVNGIISLLLGTLGTIDVLRR